MNVMTFESIPFGIREKILAEFCEYAEEGIFIADNSFRCLWVNSSFEKLSGYPLVELVGLLPSFFEFHSSIDEQTKVMIDKVINDLKTQQYFQNDISFVNRYKQRIQTNLVIWCVYEQECEYYVGALRHPIPVKKSKENLCKLLNYDPITHLPNLQYFKNKLSKLIAETTVELVVVRFTIDRFKLISGALSESQKNDLLIQFVSRIRSLDLNYLEVFAHFGKEEFAMLFEVAGYILINDEIDKINDSVRLPFLVAGKKFHLRISVGMSSFPQHGQQASELLDTAAMVLQTIQEGGGDDSSYWYSKRLKQKAVQKSKVVKELRDALDNKQFIAYYQPKIRLATNEWVGFEALVRWQHPDRGLLTATEFLQSIIDNQLTYELFEQMTAIVIHQLSIWISQGYSLFACVNVDASEFRHPTFVSYLESLLNKYPMCRNSLNIEMTETSLLINDAAAIDVLDRLRDLGINVALDDFGTGYSSLSYLQHYTFDCLKIDKSFIQYITKAQKHIEIVKFIIFLSHSLNMYVIAEGVETKEQIEILKEIGCEYAQGFYFSKPLPAEQITQQLLINYPEIS